jgi:hypothetical protein
MDSERGADGRSKTGEKGAIPLTGVQVKPFTKVVSPERLTMIRTAKLPFR